ncbi:GroES-like protein [Pseudovirgaria hyperparasitica]|uniref:GroES-like protein n=1 Tax=Pseudovirgaria hyperparasitica TaxID=470096 RepID=A0A6A6WHM2_9PEZI|nr:GroES-like protein [Pseudovirgaria hyperparasitica]KAF2762302.1 GroES-like protein [Pseudovirgaria hyperparasitica]
MKAVRFHGKEDIRIDTIPVPQVNKGQVKVKPIWCGICGSDLHEFLGGPGLCPTTPHPITGETVPLTFGHEFSGIVEEVADDVTEFKIGDRVCVQPIIYDGTCGACKAGYINCCYSNGFVGLSGWGGGLSEHIVLPKSCCYKLPDNVSLEVGALIEPLAVGWHAVELSPYKDNDSALVLGGGPIGLAVIQALKAKGCKNVIVSEVSSRRKDFARHFGADHILDPTKEDIVQRCRDLTDGWGVHVAYDCAGVQAAFKQGVLAVRARGTIVNIAIWEKDATITPNDFCFKERSYMGIATYEGGDFQLVLNAISEGRMNPEAMITKKIAFDEVVEGGFMELIRNKDNTVKILVQANKLE